MHQSEASCLMQKSACTGGAVVFVSLNWGAGVFGRIASASEFRSAIFRRKKSMRIFIGKISGFGWAPIIDGAPIPKVRGARGRSEFRTDPSTNGKPKMINLDHPNFGTGLQFY